MQYFMGIDVSTTASKALIIDKSGAVIASHGEPHTLQRLIRNGLSKIRKSGSVQQIHTTSFTSGLSR